MKEGYSKKSLSALVGPENLRYLYDLVEHPGWESLKVVNKAVKEDWINQTANLDLSTRDDEEMLRILRTRHGMIKGVDLLISYLENQRREAIKRAAEQKSSTKEENDL